jgi:hypothetical protein
MGWPYPVRSRPWIDLASFTSMADLMVVTTPLREPPYDLVAMRTPAERIVLIEHLSVTGRNDRIERPSSEAVPLFWRFMIEKFGLLPAVVEGSSGT